MKSRILKFPSKTSIVVKSTVKIVLIEKYDCARTGTNPIPKDFVVIFCHAKFELSDWLLQIFQPIRPLQTSVA